jgi:hypothetical protein
MRGRRLSRRRPEPLFADDGGANMVTARAVGLKAIQFESIDDAITLRGFRARRKNHSEQPEVPSMTAILPFHPYLPHLLRLEDAERPRWAGGGKPKS